MFYIEKLCFLLRIEDKFINVFLFELESQDRKFRSHVEGINDH